jgi:hypothetical protein
VRKTGALITGRRFRTAGLDSDTGSHRSVLRPAGADGAIGAGHVAAGALHLLPVRVGLSTDNRAVGIDVAEIDS